MVTQGILSNQIGMIGTSVSGYSTKTDQLSTDFESTLSKSLNSDDKNASTETKATSSKVNKSVKKTSEPKELKEDISSDKNVKTITKDETAISETTDVVAKNEELVEDIEALIAAGLQIVTDILQITPEELNQMLLDLDLKPEDLLTQDGLTKLFLHQSGLEDVTDLLVTQDATDQLNSLLTAVDSLVEKANLSVPKEEFSSILENHYLLENEMVNSEEIQPEDETVVTKSNEHTKVSAVTEDTVNVKEADVKIEVSSSKPQAEEQRHDRMDQDLKSDTESFIEHLAFSKQADAVNLEPVLDKVTQYREIVSQIVEQIKINISEEQTTMHMNLNPESLGKVQVSISSKNGVLNAQFMVQNDTAKEAIENQMNTLIKAFDEQGIKVQAVEVAVAEFGFQENFDQRMSGGNENQSQERQSGRRNITLEEAMSFDELTEDEQLIVDMMEHSGNQVDYTA